MSDSARPGGGSVDSAPKPVAPLGVGHIPALDGLRALAILLVLMHNFDLLTGNMGKVARTFELAMDVGWVGVQLFFVLSGFLITGALIDTRPSKGEGAKSYFRTFFGRRLVRIFPLYYAVLLVGVVLVPLALGDPLPANQIWLWTYLSNWAAPSGRGVDSFPHFWSLAVEEQFYLVWPFVVYLLSKGRLAVTCLVLMAAALAFRVYFAKTAVSEGDAERAYMFTICRMDALTFGALIAALVRMPTWADRIRRFGNTAGILAIVLAAAGAVVTKAYPRTTILDETLGYGLLTVVFGLALVFAITRGHEEGSLARKILGSKPLGVLGKYSYAIYVFHLPLHLFVGKPLLAKLGLNEGTTNPLIAIGYLLVAGTASLVAAIISFHVLEKHFLKLKTLFTPSNAPPRTAEASA